VLAVHVEVYINNDKRYQWEKSGNSVNDGEVRRKIAV